MREVGRKIDKGKGLLIRRVVKLINLIAGETLGPYSLYKLYVMPDYNKFVITDRPEKLLKILSRRDPIFKILRGTLEYFSSLGDGSKTFLVFLRSLLKKAEDLLKVMEPHHIIEGYKIATDFAISIINKRGIKFDINDSWTVERVIFPNFSSLNLLAYSNKLIELVRDAFFYGVKCSGSFNKDLVRISMIPKGSMIDSYLLKGCVIVTKRPREWLPKVYNSLRVVIVGEPLSLRPKEQFAPQLIKVNDMDKLKGFLKMEEERIRWMVNKIKNAGANAIFSTSGIDDRVSYYLIKEGVLPLRNLGDKDIRALIDVCGAVVLPNLEDLDESYVKVIDKAEFVEIEDDEFLIIEYKDSKLLTIILCEYNKDLLKEAQVKVDKALKLLETLYRNPYVLPGGGGIECYAAETIRRYALEFRDKRQISISAFADALESITSSLIKGCNLDPIESLSKLRKLDGIHGVNFEKKALSEPLSHGIFDSKFIKEEVIRVASEVARQIIRIDVLADVWEKGAIEKEIEKMAKREKKEKGMLMVPDKEEEVY